MKLRYLLYTLAALMASPPWVAAADMDGVATDPSAICPILVGATIPTMMVKTGHGEDIDLATILDGTPTILVVYRGGWCPFCNRHLTEVGRLTPELVEMGYQVVTISPDRPAKVLEYESADDHPYRMLSDSRMNAAMALGLAYRVDDALFTKYRDSYGIDLEADSGQTHHWLPVPAAFVIGADRMIRFAYVNPDYKTRVNSEVLRAAAKVALHP